MSFFQTCDLLVEQIDLARIRTDQADGGFEQRGLAAAGRSQHYARFAGVQFERDRIQRHNFLEAQTDFVEPQKAFGSRGGGCVIHHLLERQCRFTKMRVIKEVMTKTQTEAATTALVVASPTPCVPPVVRNP